MAGLAAGEAEHVAEQVLAAGRVGGVGAYGVEALQRVLAGTSGCSAVSGASGPVTIVSSCSRPSGSPKRRRPDTRSEATPWSARRVSQKSMAAADATRQTMRWTIPSPARPGIAPGYSKKVRSAPGEPFSSA